MPVALWKDLCVDVVDPVVMGPFWAAALGLELHVRERDAMHYLTGIGPEHPEHPEQTVWLNPVPEPVTVKQRVHLDLHAGSASDLLALGARPLDLDSFAWRILRDPEGGELCVFEREPAGLSAYRLFELSVDSADPAAIAAWWAEVYGAGLARDPADGSVSVTGIPGAPFHAMVFAAVPEPKTVKNRIHWDVLTDDVALLVDRGATVLREPDDDDDDIAWTVLADPEGNEFCAFRP